MQGYRHDRDGLRAVAVLPVLLYHAKLGCPGGFVGVDIFFVISGFLITSLILKDLEGIGFTITGFWERRARRIVPALTAVIAATWMGAWLCLLPVQFELFGKALIAQAVLLSNVLFFRQGLMGEGYFTDVSDTKLLLHTWSLAIEEQFYLLFPLLLAVVWKWRRPLLPWVLLTMAVVSFAIGVVATWIQPVAAFFLLPARAWELLVGALLAFLRDRPDPGGWRRECLGLAGLAMIGFSVFGFAPSTPFPGVAALVPCLGAALVIHAGRSDLSLVGKVLAFRPFTFVGRISYSLYLWHWPLLALANIIAPPTPPPHVRVALLVISGLLAVLSWRWIETPFRDRSWFAGRAGMFAFAGIASAVTLVGGVCALVFHGFPGRIRGNHYLHLVSYVDHHAYRDQISLEQVKAGQFVPLGVVHAQGPVDFVVWGDSHAMAMAPVVHDVAERVGRVGRLAAFHGTAPLFNYAPTNRFSLQKEAPAVAERVFQFIRENQVRKVILIARWSRHVGQPEFYQRLAETVRRLVSIGAEVYVVQPVPNTGVNVPRVVALASLMETDPDSLGVPVQSHLEEAQVLAPGFEEVERLGATLLDPTPLFLNRLGGCDITRNGDVLYTDSNHLTIEGARLMAPLFEMVFSTTPQSGTAPR